MGFQHIECPRDIMSEPKSTPDSMGVNAATGSASPSLIIDDGIHVRQESVDIEIPPEIHQGSEIPDSESFNPEFKNFNFEEMWEHELDEMLDPASMEIKGWAELREQIKNNLRF